MPKQAPGPKAASITRRARLIQLLSLGRYTPKDLAKTVGTKVVELIEDLEHIQKSVGKALEISPAVCDRCEYTFEDRKRLSNPSRCPECKAERVMGPWLHIDEDKLDKKHAPARVSEDDFVRHEPNEEEGAAGGAILAAAPKDEANETER